MEARDFELQPTLTGPRLELRPLRSEDLEPLYAAASDPLIWAVHPEPDRHERPVFERFFAEGLKSGGAFAAIERATGNIVGTSRYYGLDAGKSEVAIGYTFLSRNLWGGSFNRELKSLMLDHAFRFVKSVIFHVGENNVRSRKAMEKIGGVLSGNREKPGPDGTPRRDVIYRIERR
ncbi:MAG TPA: GNAT family N-acetyltransferase [Elusimicrobiota bacterium]|nr:GNAT family N-acetyltransferase [Elusimicrobiota bacterium]